VAISEDEVYQDLKPYIRTLWDCFDDAFKHYRKNYPDLTIHRKSTRATIINDLILERVIAAFDEVPGTLPLHQPNHLRYLSLSDRVTLWFKKMDDNRQTANYPTTEAMKRDGGQSNFFQEAEIVVAGYVLNDDETAIKRVCFAPPKLVTPRWFIDVEAFVQPLQMVGAQRGESTKARLKIIRSPKQNNIL
jgi:hypothetical protein